MPIVAAARQKAPRQTPGWWLAWGLTGLAFLLLATVLLLPPLWWRMQLGTVYLRGVLTPKTSASGWRQGISRPVFYRGQTTSDWAWMIGRTRRSGPLWVRASPVD